MPLDLEEVLSWRRVWGTFHVNNIMGDTVKLKGVCHVVRILGRPG